MLRISIEKHLLSSPALNDPAYSERSRVCQMFSFVFILRILLKTFSSSFLSSSYDKKAPRALIGSVIQLKPITLSLLPFWEPIHIMFVLVLFKFRPDIAPKLLIIWREVLRGAIQCLRSQLYHLQIELILLHASQVVWYPYSRDHGGVL